MTTIQTWKEQDIVNMLGNKRNTMVDLIGEKEFKKELSFAIQAINSNASLQKCTRESILKSVYNVAITGLSINPTLKYAALVPRKGECTLMPMYQGLVKLIADTGSIIDVSAHVVYEGDEFEEELGSNPKIIHKPRRESKVLTLAYATAILPSKSGSITKIEVMDKEDIYAIRERSEAYRAYKNGLVSSCIWLSDEAEMWRKTVLKRLCKYIPKTDRWIRVQEAIAIDDQDFPATNSQLSHIEMLIENSVYDEDTRSILREKVESELSMNEAANMITDLSNNQLPTITHSKNYNQADITDHIEKL